MSLSQQKSGRQWEDRVRSRLVGGKCVLQCAASLISSHGPAAAEVFIGNLNKARDGRE